MQQAMIDIYKAFQETSLFGKSSAGGKDAIGPGEQGASGASGAQKLLGPLIDRMLPSNDQFSKNNRQPDHESEFQPGSFINRVQSLALAGVRDRKGNPIPDGQWGPRTTAALSALKDILGSMSTLAQTFKTKIVDTADIQKFTASIPSKEDLAKGGGFANAKAKELYEELIGIREKLEHALPQISSPDFEQKLLGEKLDLGYSAAKKAVQDYAKLPGFGDYYIAGALQDPSGKAGVKSNLTLSDLVSPESFQAFLKKNNVSVDGNSAADKKEDLNKYLAYLKSGLQGQTLRLTSMNTTLKDPWTNK